MKIAIPQNDAILDWMAEQVERPPRRFRARRRLAADQLRCHPDLCDRLHSMGTSLPGTQHRYVAGLCVLVHANGVIWAVGGGTTWMSLRLPRHAHSAVVRSDWGQRGLDGEWIDVDPWMTDIEAHEGARRLRGWCRAAYEHAAELIPAPRPRPSTRREGPR